MNPSTIYLASRVMLPYCIFFQPPQHNASLHNLKPTHQPNQKKKKQTCLRVAVVQRMDGFHASAVNVQTGPS